MKPGIITFNVQSKLIGKNQCFNMSLLFSGRVQGREMKMTVFSVQQKELHMHFRRHLAARKRLFFTRIFSVKFHEEEGGPPPTKMTLQKIVFMRPQQRTDFLLGLSERRWWRLEVLFFECGEIGSRGWKVIR